MYNKGYYFQHDSFFHIIGINEETYNDGIGNFKTLEYTYDTISVNNDFVYQATDLVMQVDDFENIHNSAFHQITKEDYDTALFAHQIDDIKLFNKVKEEVIKKLGIEDECKNTNKVLKWLDQE